MQSTPAQRGGDTDLATNPMELMAADTRLAEHLHEQANVLPLSARDRALLYTFIESLDDDGYLRLDLDDIAQAVDLDPRPDRCELSTALKLVQSFDPAGVGARDIAECLQLQLQHADVDVDDRPLAKRILAEHIDRLAQRDVAGLAKRLDRSTADVAAACAAIRRLDPRPGWRFGRPGIQYIAPDVVVRKLRGRWTVQLNSAVVPKIRLNRVYADLFNEHRESRHGQLATHLQEARWAVRNVEQRFSTILSVAQAIVHRQHLFFEHGSFAMKPLGLKEIAEEVGLHESTVCRVTNNKYMATPGGLFELKHFFSRAMPTSNGGACSAIAIRGVMQEMIDAEDASEPLSDVDIAQRLARQGLTVARRTVTKYRQMLKLPPVEQRRERQGDECPLSVATERA
jgi:RNA polymerase sigma-54 factor